MNRLINAEMDWLHTMGRARSSWMLKAFGHTARQADIYGEGERTDASQPAGLTPTTAVVDDFPSEKHNSIRGPEGILQCEKYFLFSETYLVVSY